MAVTLGAAVLTSLSYFVSLEVDHLHRVAKSRFIEEQKRHNSQPSEFDFVIVGAGTAGCLLANKLSKHFSVLLLEEGGEAPSLLDVPAFRPPSKLFKEINDDFYLEKQHDELRRAIVETRGRVVGGSFAHNDLFYVRGNRRDFDIWAKLTGDSSWKYKEIVRLYAELENYNGPFKGTERGSNGPNPVEYGKTDILNSFKMAAEELGHNFVDSNGPVMEGFSAADLSQTPKGRAVTTCSVYVDPIRGIRKRLTVLAYAKATKIIFAGKTATGVHYSRFGKKFTAKAKKEVILSAGVYGTPLILFKSGIGPAKMLSKANIGVVADLPVGKTLENHMGYSFNITFEFQLETVYHNLTQKKFEHFLNGVPDGLLSAVGPKVQGFVVSSISKQNGESNWPDIQFVVGYSYPPTENGKTFVETDVVLVRPKGTGSFKLNTKAFLGGERKNTKLGLIEYQIFQDEQDLKRALEGTRVVLKVLQTKAFKYLGIKVAPVPECLAKGKMNTDDYWSCVIKTYSFPYYHPVGTCRMGHGLSGTNGVVNTKFCVNGIKNLRIIDASVFPTVTNGNTNAPVILLAAKGAGTILKDYQIES